MFSFQIHPLNVCKWQNQSGTKTFRIGDFWIHHESGTISSSVNLVSVAIKQESLFSIKWDLTTFKLLMNQFHSSKKIYYSGYCRVHCDGLLIALGGKIPDVFVAIFLKPVFPDTKVVFASFAFGKILVTC